MSQIPRSPTPETGFPEEIFSTGDLIERYQERLLNQLYLVSALFGIPFLIYLANQWQYSFLQWVYIAAVVYLLWLTWGWRFIRLSYEIRVWAGIFLLYAMGALSTLVFDNPLQMIIWMLGAAFLGALFLRPYPAAVNLALILVGVGVFSYMSLSDVFPPGFPLQREEPWQLVMAAFTVMTLAMQMVLVLYRRRLETALEESHRLTEILDRERARLEAQGRLLEQRVRQIRTVTEIVQNISGVLDPETLLWQFVDQVQKSFNLYYVGVFLLDPNREFAQLRAGSGDPGRRMVSEGYRLPLGGGSMIAWAIAHRQERVAQDVREDPTHFPNPYLPLTRAEAAFPLIARGEVLGAMTVQSQIPQVFDADTVQILRTLADRLALALSNARLFQQLQRTLRQLESLQRQLVLEAGYTALPGGQLQIRLGQAQSSGHALRIPLVLHGAIIGEVQLDRESPWTEEDRNLLEAALQHYISAFHMALLFRQSRLLAQIEETRRNFAERFLGRYLEIEQLLEVALADLAQRFQAYEVRLTFAEVDGASAPESRRGEEEDHDA